MPDSGTPISLSSATSTGAISCSPLARMRLGVVDAGGRGVGCRGGS